MRKLILPDNVFSRIFLSEVNGTGKFQAELSPSALISKKLISENETLGLIPTLDLLAFKDFFVSGKIGISFNGILSNAYVQFKEKQESINEIFLWGDVTANEAVLSKILFKEFYSVNVRPALLSSPPDDYNKNLLIVGDENFNKELFTNGLSFSEQIIDLLSAPYVNFVLASKDEVLLKESAENYRGKLTEGHPEILDRLFPQLPKTSLDFLSLHIQHLVFDFELQDLEGIKLLLQLPFFHGIIKDMVDVKFI
jgi:hypothetical protein